MKILRVLRPEWKRLVWCMLLALTAVAAYIQGWVFVKSDPKPFLYDALAPVPFWTIWAYLVIPLAILVSPFKMTRIYVNGVFEVLQVVYFYLLACLMVAGWRWWKQKERR